MEFGLMLNTFWMFPEWAVAQGSLCVGGPLGLTPAQVVGGCGGIIFRFLQCFWLRGALGLGKLLEKNSGNLILGFHEDLFLDNYSVFRSGGCWRSGKINI